MPTPLLTDTHRALTRLADAAQVIGKAAGEPQLYGPPERQWWRYPEEAPLQVIAVKTARVVSGLNACIHLIHAGHFVETAVLLRTVDDFLDEITFLLEAHQSGSPTTAQRDFMANFFAETVQASEEMLKDQRGPDRAKRKHVRAAQGRYLEPGNPDHVRRMALAIDSGWDGYVHGAYPHSMELYHPDNRAWTLEGSREAPYLASVQRHHAFYVSRALSVFADVCYRIAQLVLYEQLRMARDRFESSADYPDE
ncbi:MAG: hypothetical protein ABSG61_14790 [Gemmatimonadales bacterium]|jgi:hypothetical protein